MMNTHWLGLKYDYREAIPKSSGTMRSSVSNQRKEIRVKNQYLPQSPCPKESIKPCNFWVMGTPQGQVSPAHVEFPNCTETIEWVSSRCHLDSLWLYTNTTKHLCTNSTGIPGVLPDLETMYRVPGALLDLTIYNCFKKHKCFHIGHILLWQLPIQRQRKTWNHSHSSQKMTSQMRCNQ